MNSLGANIRDKRKYSQLSQTALAKELSLSGPAIISHYESNKVIPSATTLAQLANIFGISMDELYHGEIEIKNSSISNEEFQKILAIAQNFPENERPLVREIVNKIDFYLRFCDFSERMKYAGASRMR